MDQPPIGFINEIRSGFNSQSIKPGSTISFTPLERKPDGSWIILLKGRKIRVQSSIRLNIGEKFLARVLFREGRLFLKVVDNASPLLSLLKSSSLPGTDSAEKIIKSFILQGLPLKKEMLQKAFTLFEEMPRQDEKTARLIALLYDKGLFVTKEQLDRIQHRFLEQPVISTGDAEEHRRKEDGKGQGRHSGDKKRSSEDQKKLTSIIADQIERKGEDDNFFQLFNHLAAHHNNWIVIPLRFRENDGSDVPAEGLLRLRITKSGRPDMFSISISGNRRWNFRGNLTEGNRRISCSIDPLPDKKLKKVITSKLNEKLRNLSYEFDDTISEMVEFSHYDEDKTVDIRSIDTTV